MKPSEITEKHTVTGGSLAEVGAEVDKFKAELEKPWAIESIEVEADIHQLRAQGWKLVETIIRYTATVTIYRSDIG